MAITFEPLPKQFLAYQYLTDNTTNEVLYGGSIASGKSRIACYWLILMCLQHPGTRYLIGRNELKLIRQTTLNTFLDITKEWGITEMYNFNQVNNIITWNNGSEIILKDLALKPGDADYTSLGSLELTGCVIDEGAEVSEDAYQTLKTRLRYKLKEYNLVPKILICTNPAKNWMYTTFYQPFQEGTLSANKKFIAALPGDNHHLPQSYLDTLTLESLGFKKFNLLVLGNWNYAETDFDLFDHDALINSFYQASPKINHQRFITIDPASTGKDSTVISVWIGNDCVKVQRLDKLTTDLIVTRVKELMQTFQVKISNVIVDKVGVGTGVYDLLKGCVGFVANAKPLKGEPFQHLKAQLFFKFAKMVNQGEVGFASQEFRDEIILQLEAHKKINTDKEGKAEVTPKALVKQALGCSPDFADALVMRSYFEYKTGAMPVFY